MKVPPVNLVKQNLPFREEYEEILREILSDGLFVLGPRLRAFEEAFARYVGVKYALGVNSGTDALVLGLRAMGVGRGDEVITTPFTFYATVEAILLVGARPVFADIDPRTFNLNPEAVKDALTERTKVILPVHLYGQAARVEDMRFPGVAVLEDAAQAAGAERKGRKVGSLGDAAAFSFYPTKNLSALGDGGAITTDDPHLAERVRHLRVHCQGDRYVHEGIGYNSRLDEIQAAFLKIKLRHLDGWNRRRREIARIYTEALKDTVITPYEDEGNFHVFHQYTVRVEDRDGLRDFLLSRGIGVSVFYPVPLHLQKVLREEFGYREGQFPEAERAAREVLSLPIYPEMEDWQVEYVVESVREYFGRR